MPLRRAAPLRPKGFLVSAASKLAAVFLCALLYLSCAGPLLAGEVLVSQSGFAYMLHTAFSPRTQRLDQIEARTIALEAHLATWERENLRWIHLWPDIPTAAYFDQGGLPAGSAALDEPPRIVDGRTMVPLRFVGEALGAEIGWDGETRQVTYTTATRTIVLTVGQTSVLVGGAPMEMDTPPIIIGDRTMVPVRFVSWWLGAIVKWDDAARRVEIGYMQK